MKKVTEEEKQFNWRALLDAMSDDTKKQMSVKFAELEIKYPQVKFSEGYEAYKLRMHTIDKELWDYFFANFCQFNPAKNEYLVI